MTQQQQHQEPNILQPSVQQAWDVWCDARIHDITQPIVDDINKALEDVGDVVGEIASQHDIKIFEFLEIVQVLAVDNDFLSGRIDQIKREFKHQNNAIEHKPTSRTIERTIATTTEEERTSTVSQVVSVIDDILAH